MPEPDGFEPAEPALPDAPELIEPVVSGQLVELLALVEPDVLRQPSLFDACGDLVGDWTLPDMELLDEPLAEPDESMLSDEGLVE